MATLDQIQIPVYGTYDFVVKSFYGTCSTAAATAAKVVTLSNDVGWKLVPGVIIGVKFTYSNTATNVTLDVNGSGAKSIYFGNAVYTNKVAQITGWANYIIYYMYDGTNWVYLNNSANYTDSNTDTKVTQTVTTTAADYEILFSATADNTTRTEASRKNSNLLFNPSTGNLQTTQLNGVTIGSSPKFTDTTYVSQSAASGGTDVSLVTTGEKFTWNNKSDLALGSTASTAAAGNHVHGNIQNGGTLQTNDITIASGDKLVVTDSSDSSKIARASISFDGSTATKCLTQKGTFETFGTSNLALGTTASTAAKGNHTHATSIATSTGTNQLSLAANTKYALTAGGTSYVFTTPPDTTYESKAAASGGTAVSLVTTGEKYTWNNKSDLALGTTATTALKGDTKYAGASTAGGSATSAAKLDTATAGSATQPCYFANGIPSACTYALNKSVPSNAVFTDAKVAQTATSSNADYEVLFSTTADNTTRTEGARKNSNLKFNPSTGNLQATQLNGITIGSSPKFTDTYIYSIDPSNTERENTYFDMTNHMDFKGRKLVLCAWRTSHDDSNRNPPLFMWDLYFSPVLNDDSDGVSITSSYRRDLEETISETMVIIGWSNDSKRISLAPDGMYARNLNGSSFYLYLYHDLLTYKLLVL